MADDGKDGAGEGQADGTLDDRVGKLEAGQDSLAGKVDKILGILGGGGGDQAGGGGGGHAAQGTDEHVAKQIRDQLDERDRLKAEEDRKKADGDRLGSLEQRVAELTETKPAEPARRVTRLMGWS